MPSDNVAMLIKRDGAVWFSHLRYPMPRAESIEAVYDLESMVGKVFVYRERNTDR